MNVKSKMMRVELTQAIERAFTFPGYEFRRGFIYDLKQGVTLPCVWLTPVELFGKTGRTEGELRYRVTLYLLTEGVALKTEEQKERAWAELERISVEAFERLRAQECVNDATELVCTPDEFAYTGYRELSLKVTFNVQIWYCHGGT